MSSPRNKLSSKKMVGLRAQILGKSDKRKIRKNNSKRGDNKRKVMKNKRGDSNNFRFQSRSTVSRSSIVCCRKNSKMKRNWKWATSFYLSKTPNSDRPSRKCWLNRKSWSILIKNANSLLLRANAALCSELRKSHLNKTNQAGTITAMTSHY